MATVRNLVQIISLVSATTAVVACGSTAEDGGDSGGANGGKTGGVVLQPGSGGGSGMLDGRHDGGTVPLTQADLDNIETAACTGWAAEGENLPAGLQLVVDVSLSMSEKAPGTNDSKWRVTRAALADAVASLPASVSAGVLYYPNMPVKSSAMTQDIAACVNVNQAVPIALLGDANSMQRTALSDSLNRAQPNGFTPTHDAYKHALETSLLPLKTQANKFMLLITDGAPTMSLGCMGGLIDGMVFNAPTQPIIDQIDGAFDQGIRTFLIGSPGSEKSEQAVGMDMRPWLSKAAMVGGTASAGCKEAGPNFCHLDMTQAPDFSKALVDGLAAIAGELIDSCTFAVPTPPEGQNIDPNQTNLIIKSPSGEATLVLPDNNGSCSEGWQFNSSGQVVLCAKSCDKVKAERGSRVELLFGCATSEVIPVN